jgi:hypothetical protein
VVAAGLVSGVLLLAACTGGGDDADADAPVADNPPEAGPLPSIAGGIDLAPVTPEQVLVGDGLLYGQPLPSEEVAVEAFTATPEVTSALARNLHSGATGRLLGQVTVLALDGAALFDEPAVDAFVAGTVSALGDRTVVEETRAGHPIYRSQDGADTVVGFREGDQLVVVRGPSADDIDVVVDRQLAAIAAGAQGSTAPVTPLVPVPIDSAFVEVPAVRFEPFVPDEDPPPPAPPASLAGATAVAGRYGVVAGERRTTVWAFTVDPATYPSAESLQPAMAALATDRSGGASSDEVETVDRVVARADGPERSARAFRHEGLVLLVEGNDPAQVDAVTTAWITALP